MMNQIFKKLLGLIVVLFGVTVLSFAFANLSPVDPAEALAQRMYTRPTLEQIEEVREDLGLNEPLYQQYASWVSDAVRGDFGLSLISKKPAMDAIQDAFGATMSIVLLSVVFFIVFIVPTSIICAMKKGGIFDKIVHFLNIIGISVPNYWIGFMLLVVFAVAIPIFKVSSFGSAGSLILPAFALAIPVSAIGIRVLRSALISSYHCDFVTYARARGLPERKVTGMVLKHSVPPMITLFAQNFGFLLAGSATVELVFSWPGMGSLLIESLMGRDLPVINACIFIISIIVVLSNFVADMINMAINPSIGQTKEGYHA